ncbi:MAG: YbjN domain-containing protein [Myxococcales bacterium]|nr:YbjN domain-containing protein [Myxococcales bacterium]
MPSLLDVAERFFVDENWECSRLDARGILRMGFTGDQGNWMCFVQAREAQRQIAFYSVCPLRVPAAKRPLVAEFLTRANYGLVIGNFEQDWDDGEVRYKTSLDVEDCELSAMLFAHIVFANVTAMDRYLPGLVAVIAGSQTPSEAVAAVEASREPDLSKS